MVHRSYFWRGLSYVSTQVDINEFEKQQNGAWAAISATI